MASVLQRPNGSIHIHVNKVLVLATLLIFPNIATAQQNVPPPIQSAAADAEGTARRFGVGVQGGIGLDPEGSTSTCSTPSPDSLARRVTPT